MIDDTYRSNHTGIDGVPYFFPGIVVFSLRELDIQMNRKCVVEWRHFAQMSNKL